MKPFLMSLWMKNEDILNEIFKKRGDCLDVNTCKVCPFEKECAAELMKNNNKQPEYIKQERIRKAINLIIKQLFLEKD